MSGRELPARAAGGFLSYFTRHATAANLLMVVMLVLGLVAATKFRSQFFLDVVIEQVVVSVVWGCAGSADGHNPRVPPL